MRRKVTIRECLAELLANSITVYVCYALVAWESNPLRWKFITQCFAMIMICVYFPYLDDQRWRREQGDK